MFSCWVEITINDSAGLFFFFFLPFSLPAAPWWFTVCGPLERLGSADSGCRALFSHSAGLECKDDSLRKRRKTHGFILRTSRGYCRAAARRFYVVHMSHVLCIHFMFPPPPSVVVSVSQEIIEVESENVFKLAANALQVSAWLIASHTHTMNCFTSNQF